MTADRYAAGFVAGLATAARVCLDFAEDLDRRPEDARIAGVHPAETVRRLRQAASRIRDRVNDQEKTA